MSKQREDIDFIADIEDSAEKIVRYVSSMTFDSFCEDSRTMDAVIRNLEIIGEATKSISDSLKLKTPEIAWRGMAGLRDRLIHNYFGVDVEIVWKIAGDEVPALIERLHKINGIIKESIT
jgi:uncharacterized protein with HEPN domain